MKKILILTMVLGLVLGIVGISHASVDNIYEAAVVNISGDVKVDTKADGTWITPWVGMKLQKGAIVKTGEGASADLVFDAEGLNLLSMEENATLIVGKDEVELPIGVVSGKFDNLTANSTFVVKTPTAACAIRGTTFRISFSAGGYSGTLQVELVNGKMTVQRVDANGNLTGSKVEIPAGTSTSVSGGQIGEPTALTASQIQAIESGVTFGGAAVTIGAVPGETFTTDVDGKDLEAVKKDEGKKEVSPSE
ncbi:FecR domain-containing protein [Candidatus Omnitrophota bacterium]